MTARIFSNLDLMKETVQLLEGNFADIKSPELSAKAEWHIFMIEEMVDYYISSDE